LKFDFENLSHLVGARWNDPALWDGSRHRRASIGRKRGEQRWKNTHTHTHTTRERQRDREKRFV